MNKIFTILAFMSLTACGLPKETLTAFKDPQTGLYGFKGSSNVVVIEPEYEAVKPFGKFETTTVYVPGKGWTIIDRFGSVVGGK